MQYETTQTAQITPRAAAQFLSISERLLYSLTKTGRIRCVRIGRAVRYPIRELEDFIRRGMGEDRIDVTQGDRRG